MTTPYSHDDHTDGRHTIERRKPRLHVLIIAVSLAIVAIGAVAATVMHHDRSTAASDDPRLHAKLISPDAVTHVDVIVAPASGTTQAILDSSRLVGHYALLRRGDRTQLLPNGKSLNKPVLARLCDVQSRDEFLVQAASPDADIASDLSRALGRRATVDDTNDLLGADLEVFFQVGASSEQIDSVRSALAADPDVASARFVNQNEAYAIFRKEFADQPKVLSGSSPAELPASFRVIVNAAPSAGHVGKRYQQMDGVDTTVTSDDRVHALVTDVTPADIERATSVGDNGGAEIFMRVDASAAQIEAVRAKVTNDGDVRSSRYVDQSEAYAIFRTDFADSPNLVKATKPSDLPASFRADFGDAESADAARPRYQRLAGVDQIITATSARPKIVSPCSNS